MTDYLIQGETLTGIADAIRGKTGGSEPIATTDMASKIDGITSGGLDLESDINFVDYDGTLLYTYSFDEIKGIEKLPEPPQHDGLISQGWNWDLDDLKTVDGRVVVGAVYITDDGATRIVLSMTYYDFLSPTLYFSQTVSDGVRIDWGDDSPVETIAGTGFVNVNHQYAKTGNYTISLTPLDDCILQLGTNDVNDNLFGKNNGDNFFYFNYIKEAFYGKNVEVVSGLRNAYDLDILVIPNGVKSIMSYFLSGVVLTKCIILPESIETIGQYTNMHTKTLSTPKKINTINSLLNTAYVDFVYVPDCDTINTSGLLYFCYKLTQVRLPDGITDIGGSFANTNKVLSEITIPETVKTIGGYAFDNCTTLRHVYMKPPVPPSIQSTSFKNNYTIFHVPKGSLEAYQQATNWSQFTDRIQEMES